MHAIINKLLLVLTRKVQIINSQASDECFCLSSSYLTLSGSVTVKFRRAEQAVSMLGSLLDPTPLFPLRELQHCDRKSTSRAGVSRVSSTFLGPSSADR